MDFHMFTFKSDYIKEKMLSLENCTLLASKLPTKFPRVYFTRDITASNVDCEILVIEVLKKELMKKDILDKVSAVNAETILVTSTPLSSLDYFVSSGMRCSYALMENEVILEASENLIGWESKEPEETLSLFNYMHHRDIKLLKPNDILMGDINTLSPDEKLKIYYDQQNKMKILKYQMNNLRKGHSQYISKENRLIQENLLCDKIFGSEVSLDDSQTYKCDAFNFHYSSQNSDQALSQTSKDLSNMPDKQLLCPFGIRCQNTELSHKRLLLKKRQRRHNKKICPVVLSNLREDFLASQNNGELLSTSSTPPLVQNYGALQRKYSLKRAFMKILDSKRYSRRKVKEKKALNSSGFPCSYKASVFDEIMSQPVLIESGAHDDSEDSCVFSTFGTINSLSIGIQSLPNTDNEVMSRVDNVVRNLRRHLLKKKNQIGDYESSSSNDLFGD